MATARSATATSWATTSSREVFSCPREAVWSCSARQWGHEWREWPYGYRLTCQPNLSPGFPSAKSQKSLLENFLNLTGPNIWPPKSKDCNLMSRCLCGVAAKNTSDACCNIKVKRPARLKMVSSCLCRDHVKTIFSRSSGSLKVLGDWWGQFFECVENYMYWAIVCNLNGGNPSVTSWDIKHFQQSWWSVKFIANTLYFQCPVSTGHLSYWWIHNACSHYNLVTLVTDLILG